MIIQNKKQSMAIFNRILMVIPNNKQIYLIIKKIQTSKLR